MPCFVGISLELYTSHDQSVIIFSTSLAVTTYYGTRLEASDESTRFDHIPKNRMWFSLVHFVSLLLYIP